VRVCVCVCVCMCVCVCVCVCVWGSVPSTARGVSLEALQRDIDPPLNRPGNGGRARIGPRGRGSPRSQRAAQGELPRRVCGCVRVCRARPLRMPLFDRFMSSCARLALTLFRDRASTTCALSARACPPPLRERASTSVRSPRGPARSPCGNGQARLCHLQEGSPAPALAPFFLMLCVRAGTGKLASSPPHLLDLTHVYAVPDVGRSRVEGLGHVASTRCSRPRP
jgi:hypothetical protein